ncbi:GNAT family N-acetyltransferase [Desulfosporosinus metallidurans]|uniref:Acetyltransferase, GNAT family n=1 Tax=Desulfosporosinus metallidurans TaxID=1888891 RepID=A0A1Q8QV08_9FIRM|nr:GNAT family N-acetyltransferase [Desulfosporosinus metallidurans]OLN31160.1 Acetyltransferase, GNAT family [Desulfosporosinus metallidurans]
MFIKGYVSLGEKVLNEVLNLERICNDYDNLLGSMFLDSSLNFNHCINCVFLLYENRELISMLSMFIPTQQEAEITGYTLPKYRRNGYFKALLAKAVEELRKFNIPEILFVCETQSNSGKQVINALKAEYEHTEYSMRLDQGGSENRNGSAYVYRLLLLRPELEDLEKVIETSIRTFDEPYEDAKSRIENCFESETREQYLAVLNNVPIGLGSTNQDDEVGSIFGFGIVPEYRGKGYGEELLHLIVDRLWQKGKTEITLDVNSDNAQALALYQKFGFKIVVAYEYYRQKLPVTVHPDKVD